MSTGGVTSSSPPGGTSITAGFVGASVGILLLLAIIASAAFYICCAAFYICCARTPAAGIGTGAPRGGRDVEGGGGVDEATLEACPAMAYGELRKKKKQQEEAEGCCCPVCLESYGDGEVVRELPECGHVFHRGCVDPWLRRRATCPVCRASPLRSPLS